eukprot:TRINITY_DN5847_c0_g1_i1.p1 TRINITY_DN5847_c0_g1~~TRINITY_DN5847_c0_g1_i1.p1  ORF type:complete len:483 (+),score=100.18 TRINITY_DN5847_c0_g1_i1:1387-2835(+)
MAMMKTGGFQRRVRKDKGSTSKEAAPQQGWQRWTNPRTIVGMVVTGFIAIAVLSAGAYISLKPGSSGSKDLSRLGRKTTLNEPAVVSAVGSVSNNMLEETPSSLSERPAVAAAAAAALTSEKPKSRLVQTKSHDRSIGYLGRLLGMKHRTPESAKATSTEGEGDADTRIGGEIRRAGDETTGEGGRNGVNDGETDTASSSLSSAGSDFNKEGNNEGDERRDEGGTDKAGEKTGGIDTEVPLRGKRKGKRQLKEEGDKECGLEFVGGTGRGTYGAWPICGALLKSGGLVYSFGLGGDVSFDMGMIEKGYQVFGFDPTKSEEWIRNLFVTNHNKADIPPEFHFHRIGLGAKDGTVVFLKSTNKNIDSKTAVQVDELTKKYVESGIEASVLRLKTIMCSNDHKHIDVLKMDVEGLEFDVCLSSEFREALLMVDQVLIEFHQRMVKDGYGRREECIGVMKEKGYRLVYESSSKQETVFMRSIEALS